MEWDLHHVENMAYWCPSLFSERGDLMNRGGKAEDKGVCFQYLKGYDYRVWLLGG